MSSLCTFVGGKRCPSDKSNVTEPVLLSEGGGGAKKRMNHRRTSKDNGNYGRKTQYAL